MIFLVAVCVAACTARGESPAAPTQILIPSTATATDVPLTPTETPEPLPAPGDLATALPEISPVTDSIAAELGVLAQRRIAEQLDLPTRRVNIVEISPVLWTDSSLGCPQPEQIYAPVEITGYRIVIEAADTQYLFHTDSERLMPCDAENERLPEAEVTSETPFEATAEVTAELPA